MIGFYGVETRCARPLGHDGKCYQVAESLPADRVKTQKYFVHDKTRGFVGNSMVWWRQNHRGYTTNINEAHAFTEEELREYCQADDLVAYPVELVRDISEPHVVQMHLLRGKAKEYI